MTISDDYTENDRWDWDKEDKNQYCHHGTFIGSWWGPDIMCGACESGEPDPSINDMVNDIIKDIEKLRNQELGMWDFLQKSVDVLKEENASDDLMAKFASLYIDSGNEYADRIKFLRDKIERTEDYYGQFVDDFDDTSVLYREFHGLYKSNENSASDENESDEEML